MAGGRRAGHGRHSPGRARLFPLKATRRRFFPRKATTARGHVATVIQRLRVSRDIVLAQLSRRRTELYNIALTFDASALDGTAPALQHVCNQRTSPSTDEADYGQQKGAIAFDKVHPTFQKNKHNNLATFHTMLCERPLETAVCRFLETRKPPLFLTRPGKSRFVETPATIGKQSLECDG